MTREWGTLVASIRLNQGAAKHHRRPNLADIDLKGYSYNTTIELRYKSGGSDGRKSGPPQGSVRNDNTDDTKYYTSPNIRATTLTAYHDKCSASHQIDLQYDRKCNTILRPQSSDLANSHNRNVEHGPGSSPGTNNGGRLSYQSKKTLQTVPNE